MPAYDASLFSPPAPVAHVLLRNPDSGATWADVPMLIDTGADVTLVPRAALAKLGASVVADRRYEVTGFDGRSSGNILNAIPLLLDGPLLTWAEHGQTPPR